MAARTRIQQYYGYAVCLVAVIAVFVAAVVLGGIIAWKYLFPVPALFSLALCVPLVVAFITAGRGPVVSAPAGQG